MHIPACTQASQQLSLITNIQCIPTELYKNILRPLSQFNVQTALSTKQYNRVVETGFDIMAAEKLLYTLLIVIAATQLTGGEQGIKIM